MSDGSTGAGEGLSAGTGTGTGTGEGVVPRARAAAWVYSGLWRVLVDWFRVPMEPPTLPVRGGDHLESFKPAPAFLRYLKLWFWLVALIGGLGLAAGWIAVLVTLWWVALAVLPLLLILVGAGLAVGYLALHLRYDTTWYVMTDRSLRIRRGVWLINEMTFTFENVQNVSVRQGPVQRWLGISSVLVETAGGSAEGKKGLQVSNQGLIEGIDDPQPIREKILARMRLSRGTGLGDDDEDTRGGGAWTEAHLEALRGIRDGLERKLKAES